MTKEEVIFVGYDTSWDFSLPVTLITYSDGSMDLHRQTGSQYSEHVAEALKILLGRGLALDENAKGAIGSTGVYSPLKKVNNDQT